MSDFKKLHVWQKAHALSLCVDRVSKQIRGGRYSSLRNQIFRAATSIPANIAEGRRQESEKEFARFLRYALNSSSGLEYHLILAHDQGHLRRGLPLAGNSNDKSAQNALRTLEACLEQTLCAS